MSKKSKDDGREKEGGKCGDGIKEDDKIEGIEREGKRRIEGDGDGWRREEEEEGENVGEEKFKWEKDEWGKEDRKMSIGRLKKKRREKEIGNEVMKEKNENVGKWKE